MSDSFPQALRNTADHREGDLVVLAVRAYLSGVVDADFQAALAQSLHWEAVERIADSHAILPLLIYALNQYGAEAIPRETREHFQQRWVLAARNNLIQMQEWHRVLQAFDAAGLPALSFKGPALAFLAYRNAGLREFTDLDFLVRPEDIPAARDVLVREGYRLRSAVADDTEAALLHSGNRQLDFVNEARGTVVDLHWGAVHEMFSFQLPLDRLFESARIEHQEGRSFLSLSPEHLLLYLCAHGTKHCWLHLRDLCDVVFYVTATPALDWELCLALAKSTNCDFVLKHALLLTQRVLGLELPSTIRNYCEDAKARALANTAQSFLFRENSGIGHRETLRYHLAFAKDWRARVRFLLERVFVPAEEDWQRVRLPQPLHFLYYLIRPVRLLLERFSKAR
jgi:hypothetical protein